VTYIGAVESVGAPLDDGPPDPELGPVIHAPAAIEDVVLAVARAIGLDHEPPGSVEELLTECRKLRAAPASSSADDPALDATDGAHPAWWRGHDHTAEQMRRQLSAALGINGDWQALVAYARRSTPAGRREADRAASSAAEVEALAKALLDSRRPANPRVGAEWVRARDIARQLTEARARQPQPRTLETIMDRVGELPTSVLVGPAPEAAAGEVADLLREADETARGDFGIDGTIRRLAAALRASEAARAFAERTRDGAESERDALRTKLEQAELQLADTREDLSVVIRERDVFRVDLAGAKWQAKEANARAEQAEVARAEAERDVSAPCDKCGHGKSASWSELEAKLAEAKRNASALFDEAKRAQAEAARAEAEAHAKAHAANHLAACEERDEARARLAAVGRVICSDWSPEVDLVARAQSMSESLSACQSRLAALDVAVPVDVEGLGRRPCPVDDLDETARAVYAACVAINEPRLRFATDEEMRGIVSNAIKTAKAEQAERARRGGGR
jgi:hypothetical protein